MVRHPKMDHARGLENFVLKTQKKRQRKKQRERERERERERNDKRKNENELISALKTLIIYCPLGRRPRGSTGD